MFGSHDHDDDKQDDKAPVTEVVADNSSDNPAFDTSNVSLPGPVADGDLGAGDSNDNDDPKADVTLASDLTSTQATTPATAPATKDDDQILSTSSDDDLIRIKQDALKELSPLVDHLEQSPEEKFRTTMMMIQASDDQSLLQTAFAAAKEISDDKARAQALLDVINEINYFTQQAK